jgi:hypothetical protein
MKFVLFVEGDTERLCIGEFLKRWLDPQLSERVGIQPVKFTGYANFNKEVVKKANAHLNSPKESEIIAVIGLLDLAGPGFYPKHVKTADEKYAWGKKHFEEEVNNERFRMFFAVHEFEAWLLSQPDIFPREVQPALKKIPHPERVNFDEPPAKLLKRIYREKLRRNYHKTTHGKLLFKKLDPNIAVSKCPYLKAMLQDMLKMAKDAGL